LTASRRLLIALLGAMVVNVIALDIAAGGCGTAIDAFPKRTLAVEFATSVADGRRVVDAGVGCTDERLIAAQAADVPFIVLYILVGGSVAFLSASFSRLPVAAAVATTTVVMAGVCDLLEDTAILRIAHVARIPSAIADAASTYGVAKWRLFFVSSVALAAALGEAAIRIDSRGRRAAFAGAAMLALASGVVGLRALSASLYAQLTPAVIAWFVAAAVVAVPRDATASSGTR